MPTTPLTPGLSAGAARHGGLVTTGRTPSSYDFLRPAKLPREHLRTLQLGYEAFAHRLASLLTSTLRVVCRVDLASIEQLSYEEHVSGLANPTVLVPVALEPLTGTSLFEISLDSVLTSLDYMLGGAGGPQPERLLSDIETVLFRDLLENCFAELRLALEPIVPITPRLGAFEYNPQMVQTSSMSDAVIVSCFEVGVGEKQSEMTLCVPLSGIQPSLQRYRDQVMYSDSERATREIARHLLTESIQDVPVGVSVRFDSVRLLPRELVNLRPGDVIPLDHPVDRPLEITTAGEIFGHAVATKRGSQLACLVVPAPDKEKNSR